MPRDSNGNYSLPSGSLVSDGETIAPSQHNPPLQDIGQSLTGSLSRNGNGGMLTHLNMGGFRATNMAAGVQPTDGATVSQLTGISGVPVGAMMDWPSATAPTGWLVCAGQTLSRTDYADLFAIVGTTFGAPSGSTFQLPDLRGRVAAGLDVDSGGYADRLTTPNSRTLGASGGTQTVTLTTAEMPAHTHTLSGSVGEGGSHDHSFLLSDSGGVGTTRAAAAPGGSAGSQNVTTVGTHTHPMSGTANSTGGGGAHANVQPTLILNKIIKVSSS